MRKEKNKLGKVKFKDVMWLVVVFVKYIQKVEGIDIISAMERLTELMAEEKGNRND